MRPYLLTSSARKDVVEIGRFTTEKWGKRQRDTYLRQLDDASSCSLANLILAAIRVT